MLKPKFGYKYLGLYNDLENQLLYDKNTGDIYTYHEKPKNILDKIASRHDTCYSIGKNKNDCDRTMVEILMLIFLLIKYKEWYFSNFFWKTFYFSKM